MYVSVYWPLSATMRHDSHVPIEWDFTLTVVPYTETFFRVAIIADEVFLNLIALS